MRDATRSVVYWAPRLLGIAFAAFLGLFAADVFDLPLGPSEKALALLLHLVPSLLVLLGLALAWRREWIAALVFPLLAALHVALKLGQLHWSAYLVIDGPLILMGALFLLSWRQRAAIGDGGLGSAS